MQIRTADGRREHRSVTNPSMSSSFGDQLWMTGVVPPNGFNTLNRAGVSIIERNVTTATPVNACLDILTNHLLWVGDPRPFQIAYAADGSPYHQPVKPIPTLLSTTWGPEKSQAEGTSELIYSLGLFNEAFLLTVTRDRMGNPTALEILPAPFVQKTRVNGQVTYGLALGGQMQPLPAADITHIRLKSRPGHLRAMSSLVSESLGYALFLAAMSFGLAWFGQGSAPSYLLTTDNQLTDEQARKIVQKLIVEHSGLSTAHLPMLLDAGLKAQKIGSTPDEAQYLQTLSAASDDIAAYFGVPANWVRQTETDSLASNASKLQDLTTWFVRRTLIGYIRPVEHALSRLLGGDTLCEFNVRPLLRGTGADVAKEILALRTACVFSPDMILREYFDLPPLPDGQGADPNAPLASNQTPAVGAAVNSNNDGSGD